jgi:hypothetical protein
MKFEFELTDEQTAEMVETFLKEADKDDPVGPLGLAWNDKNEPILFFCPDWEIQYEARLSLRDALENELTRLVEMEEPPEKIDLIKRLIAVLNEAKT